MPVALTIAGSDPTGGAGLQADLKTFAALGVYGASVVTAITAQSTQGVVDTFPLPADVVSAQFDALGGDITVDATKTGMLGNDAIVESVAAMIVSLDLPRVVVDPVLAATSGGALLAPDAISTLKHELLRHAFVVTPNVPEAEILSGLPIRTIDDVKKAAERIHRLGPRAVIIKGGHLAGPHAIDLLFDGEQMIEFPAPRLPGPPAHGTGCAFSAALAAGLALGRPLPEATEQAKHYVTGALRHRLTIGRGAPLLDHFWERYT
ncbi:MAG TPA: bifunctional hydroxymethylpyrimidine kinase/phosphomethylpyrimidine kinase [Vicinamibacterales bacterium]|nr:bifunctional hydroxymethylpyrimidine kinase/phosphomethylpyrimidine kinase [Vicinamibacterales bacterium]